MMTVSSYPLSWPAGRPRCARRADAQFGKVNCRAGQSWGTKENLTVADALRRLQDELDKICARHIVLSTNVETRLDVLPRSGQPEPTDPGAALYFQLKGRDTVLACDKWNRVADNIAAIAKHIDALRGIERWGIGTVEQAFAGWQALPAPEPWWTVLGVASNAGLAEIDAAWREKMRDAHPDRGGTDAAASRLNWARDEARRVA